MKTTQGKLQEIKHLKDEVKKAQEKLDNACMKHFGLTSSSIITLDGMVELIMKVSRCDKGGRGEYE